MRKNPTDGRQTAVGRPSDGRRTDGKFLDGRKNTKKSERHFWANFTDRPEIFEYRNPILKNPGTIGEIRPKVACRFFARNVAKKCEKIDTPLLGEFRRSSQDF